MQLNATAHALISRHTPAPIISAMKEVLAGRNKTWSEFKVPEETIGCGFHEAVRGVLLHHVVIREGKVDLPPK